MSFRAGIGVLLAVLVFAAGLAILQDLEREVRRELESARAGDFDPGVLATDVDAGPGLTVDGGLQVNHYAQTRAGVRTRTTELSAVDTESEEGGATLLEDVRIVLNDAASGDVRAVVRAARGRTYLVDPVLGPRPDAEHGPDHVWLEDLDVTFYRDVPVAPLVLRVDHLEGSLETQNFTSADPARATAPGMEAEGTGLLLALGRGVLRFDADARVRLFGEGRDQAILSSEGKLHVLRSARGAEVFARDAARLQTFGDTPLVVLGDRINASAVEVPDQGLRLVRLSADPNAELETPFGRFEAGRADLRAGEDGGWIVSLEEEPRAELVYEPPEEGEPLAVALSGAGPLEVLLRDDVSFQLAGPARATMESIVLESRGGLRGGANAAGDVFRLQTAVRTTLERGEDRLVAEAVTAEMRPAEGRRPDVHVTTAGETLLTGIGEAGAPYRVDATRALSLVGRGERWLVRTAEGVALDLGGPDPATITARTVRDLDPDARTLVAEGEVDVRRGDRRAQGERFEGRGAERFTLYGSDEVPALLTAPGASVAAGRIERDGPELAADGDAVARLEDETGTARVRADRLELYDRAPERPGTRLELRSRGAVEAEVVRGEQRFEGSGNRLRAELERELDADGAVLASRGYVELEGGVRARGEAPGLERELSCERVRVDHRAPAEREWDLLAEGELTFSERGALEIEGRGDRLVADEGRGAALFGTDGRRVHVEGLLPGSDNPFALDAPEVHWSEQTLRARDVELHVSRFVLLESTPGSARGEQELVARAREATLREESLFLEGDVRLDGVDEEGSPVALEAGRARLTGNPEAEAGGYGRLDADGGFAMSWGGMLEVVGDALDARSAAGRLRITGDPAEVRYGQYVQVSEFLEYDLYLRMIVGTTRSSVRPREGAPSPVAHDAAPPDAP